MAATTTKMIEQPSRNFGANQATRKLPAEERKNGEDFKTGRERQAAKSSALNRSKAISKYMPALCPSTAAWLRGKAIAASAAAAARNKAAASVTAAAHEARRQKNAPPKPKPVTKFKAITSGTEIDSIKRRRKAKNDNKPDSTTKRNSLAKTGARPPRPKKNKAKAAKNSENNVATSPHFTPSPGVSEATGVARKPSKTMNDDGSSTTSGSSPTKGKGSEVSSVISDRKPPAVGSKNNSDDNASSKRQSKKKLPEDDPAIDNESNLVRSTKKKKKLLISSDQSTKKSKRKLIKQDPALDGTTRSAPSRIKRTSKDTDDIVKQKSADSDDKNKHRLRYASPVHGEKPRRSIFHQSRPDSSKSALQKQRRQDEEKKEEEDDESSSDDDARATIPGAICIKEDDDGESFDGSELTPSVYTMDTRQIPVAAELAPEAESLTETEAVKRMVALELQKERESQVIVEAVKVPQKGTASRPRSMLQLPSLAEESNAGSNKRPPNYYCIACAAVCLLLVIVIGITLGVTLKKEVAAPLPDASTPIGSNLTFAPTIAQPTAAPVSTAPAPPTPQPTSGPTKNPIMENVLHIVLQRYKLLLRPDAVDLLEPNTPQFAALNWMANEDEYLADAYDIVSGSEIAERYALVVFFYSTIGQKWFDDYGFLNSLSPGSVCDWGYGNAITCDGKKSITSLILSDNGLDGYIPRELAFLSNLQQLVLEHNSIAGTLPKELSTLKMMESLSLLANKITGSIPSEYGLLASIRSINLEYNILSDHIPTQIGSMASLRELFLAFNGFSLTLPTEIGSMTNLEVLDLFDNMISGVIPSEIGKLSSSLYQLNLGANAFAGTIPAELGDLSALQILDLHNNSLSGELPNLGRLTNLALLHIQHNIGITGAIPESLSQLTALEELRLAGTSLWGDFDAIVCFLDRVSYSSASCGDGFIECQCCTECCNVISFEEDTCG